MSKAYDPVEYWNSLSGAEMRLSEVGWPNWTEAYNEYRYKLSLEQVSETLDRHLTREPRQILEVGCGVGFWTKYLVHRFPGSRYLGVDISKAAVSKLRERYAGAPQASFECADIVEYGRTGPTADLVVCLEVLLHIVDNRSWAAALENIARILEPGGLALISDPIAQHSSPPPYTLGNNSRVRHLTEWRAILDECGLEVVEVLPRTLLLDDNFDFRSPLGARLWRRFFGLYSRLLSIRNERLGTMLGFAAYQVDKRYAVPGRPGHSCKMLVIRRAPTSQAKVLEEAGSVG
jgi:SAM-dependent methyltransferase